MGEKAENEGEDVEAEGGEKEQDVVVMEVCGVGEGDWIKKEVENLEERQAKVVEEVQAEDDQNWDQKDLKNQTQQDMRFRGDLGEGTGTEV